MQLLPQLCPPWAALSLHRAPGGGQTAGLWARSETPSAAAGDFPGLHLRSALAAESRSPWQRLALTASMLLGLTGLLGCTGTGLLGRGGATAAGVEGAEAGALRGLALSGQLGQCQQLWAAGLTAGG